MYGLTQYFIQSVHEFDMYDILTSIISEFQSVFYIGGEAFAHWGHYIICYPLNLS